MSQPQGDQPMTDAERRQMVQDEFDRHRDCLDQPPPASPDSSN